MTDASNDRTLNADRAPMATLSHVVLRTADADKAMEFYEKLLGMTITYRSPHGGGAISNDGEHHRIALAQVPPADSNPMAPGLEHIAFKLRGVADLLGNYKRLRDEHDILPFMSIHHGGTLSAYYLDPDGVQVETFIDTAPLDVSIENMNTEGFAKNPIGVPIDFDELVDRFEAGASIASFMEQPELQDGQLDELIQKVMAARMSSTAGSEPA